MVSTVIIDIDLFMILLSKPSAIHSPYSPEARSLQQKYHSFARNNHAGSQQCQNFWE